MSKVESWGRYPQVTQKHINLNWRDSISLKGISDGTVLPHGQGRSYGDCCLNQDGTLLLTKNLDRVISFDSQRGILRAEAGITLEQILDLVVPAGWFLPVTPGTKYVSLGGAVANDVHGKNHHIDGTFGNHVLSFELLRSDGTSLFCSPSENKDMFAASIAGLGLTGLILWVELKLKSILSASIQVENIKFENLNEFFEISASSSKDYYYTVSWLDCLSKEGRGIFMRGDHSTEIDLNLALERVKKPKVSVPFDAPSIALHSWNMKLFNQLYFHKQISKKQQKTVHYDPFFYPLDAVKGWNRLYGKRGFFQFQCVVPRQDAALRISQILEQVKRDGNASFLAVLKEFGEIEAVGMMSFPAPGTTLCLDFANRGGATRNLLRRLDQIVKEAGGKIYPAKDALMPAESFKQYFPRWKEFSDYIDPKFSSSFWRRVTEND